MEDQSSKVGFKFIQNPEGQALTGDGLLRSSIAKQQERDHHQQVMTYSGICLAVVLLAAALVLMRKSARR